jgi:hypothetical protein
MTRRYEDYAAVRTQGSLGGQGADGIRMNARKLYVCYSPEMIDVAKVTAKFWSDLESATRQRPGQFGTFVFVFNNKRGMHPEVATMLAEARDANPGLLFESMGCIKLWHEVMKLSKEDCEDLFGEIPVEEVVYGIGLADVQPLLDHLAENRQEADPAAPVEPPNYRKMQYNKLSPDYQEQLKRGMRDSRLVEEYYERINDTLMADEVASGFTEYYRQARAEADDDPDEIMWQMERYVMGNQHPRQRMFLAVWAVLTYFFERCHFFEAPPAGWVPEHSGGAGI